MVKTKKAWLSILSFLCVLCFGLGIFFCMPRTTAVAESPNVSIDFEETSDSNNFAALNGVHSISDGKLNLTQWVYSYYKIPISTTGIRIITMDMYIKSGAGPAFGLMNVSKFSKDITTADTGVYWNLYSATNTRLTGHLNYYTGGSYKEDYTDRSYLYDTVHKLEITIRNKAVTFTIDGSTLISSSTISTALTDRGLSLEDEVYFCVGEGKGGEGSYIDNFEIKDSFEKATDYSIDFEETADANNFTKFYGTKWSVGNGTFNKTAAAGILYYNTAIPTQKTRIISMDVHLASGAKPVFGFINESKLSGITDATNAGKGSGIYWIQSSATNRRLTNYWNKALGGGKEDYSNRSYLWGTTFRLEITIIKGKIEYIRNGSTLISASDVSEAMTSLGVTLEENVYFCFGSDTTETGTYIDNFEIKDYLEKGANYAIDFDASADANNFTKFYGTKWSVGDGTFNKTAAGIQYYNTIIPTQKTRIISMDVHLASGAKPVFGFINESKLSGITDATNAGKGSGIYWIQSSATNRRLTNYWNKALGGGKEDYSNRSYLWGTTFRLEITIIKGKIEYIRNGSTLISASDVSEAMTSLGVTLEENVYFCFGSDTTETGTYIDNFEIKDYVVTGIPDEDFSLLDKYALTGNVQMNAFTYGTDMKDCANGAEMYNYLTTTKAGNNGRGYDLTGADYISFAVNNQSGIAAGFKVILAEGADVDVNGNATSAPYGRRWTSAEKMPYYLEYANGKVEGNILTTQENNMAYASVPNGFEGRVVFPITSFEALSWSNNINDNLEFSTDANAISLGFIRFMNIVYYKSGTAAADGSLVISNPMIYGDYIPAVANSTNRVVNAINNIGTVTAASEAQIAFAREQYDDLSDKSGVKNYATLQAAETAFAALEDNTYVVATDGKDFTGTGGVAFGEVWTATPSTISAWIKVDASISDNTHVGTIVGNMGRIGSSWVEDSENSFSFEVTTNGNLKIEWRRSSTTKAILVAENVDVRTGAYMHVAFTRNASTGRLALYVNGVKVAEQDYPWASLRDLSFVNPVIIGSDYTNDEIHALGFTPDFNGFIADVRVYSSVLTAEQIAQDALGEVQNSLMANVEFISGEENEYYDSANQNATDAFGWKEYSSLEDLKLGDYTFAVIPDTQMLFSVAKDSTGKSLFTPGYNIEDNLLYKNNTWLVENQQALGLKFVMHLGDLTDSLNYKDKWNKQGAAELYYAMESMDVLTDAGIPWSLSRGNHDAGATAAYLEYWDNGFTEVTYNGVTYSTTGYSASTYGVGSERISNLTTSGALLEFGSMAETDMRNTYYTFAAGDEKWLVVALDLEPTDDVITWANEIIAARADHKTIITTHAYMTSTGSFMTSAMISGNYGEALWTKLASKHSNVVMFLCGHSTGQNVVRKQLTGENGNKVWNFMIDISSHEIAGNHQTGVFALFGIADNGNTLHVNYLSPSEGKLFRSINQFTVSLGELETVVAETKQILDLDGNVALEIATDFTGELPVLERSGHIFLGYLVDGTLYATYTYTGAETSVKAVFATFTMYNGAATRIGDYGMRFSAYLDMTVEELSALGISVSYGTLIAPDYAITVDGNKGGVKDYSKMVLENVGRYMINVPSTKQLTAKGYTIINASPTAISLETQLELELVARTYMKVTYADGTEAVFYAGVTDNGRSIKEVAALALADISKVQSAEYQYAVEGGYSPYKDEDRTYLQKIVG